ncbi:hypothetical protein, partial [Ferrovum sp.]|uniref:hypothetical protein n=1 Tax=Ferrovum sp. TaxID=2609467 RepID=UPI002620CE4A
MAGLAGFSCKSKIMVLAAYEWSSTPEYDCSSVISQVGYPAKCCDVKIMQWNQASRKCDQSPPELGSITRATTPSLWRGFQMTPP